MIIFPPFGEEWLSEVDIKIGIVTVDDSKSIYRIGTNSQDLWSPEVEIVPIPIFYYEKVQFSERLNLWMKMEIDEPMIIEYYEFTTSNIFKDIVGSKIKKIELLTIEGKNEPFGIKLSFESDFILSFPNSDGNTIETKNFNCNESLERFSYLGNPIYNDIMVIEKKL